MTLCSAPHPEQTSVLCDKKAPCYGFHANAGARLTWKGNPLPETPKPEAKTRKGQLAMIAQRASR